MNHLCIFASLLLACFSITKCHKATICVNICPVCYDEKRDSECPPAPDCPNQVKEPGCGCCMVCAREEGQSCGVQLPKCGPGLACMGRNGERSLSAIMNNIGVCQKTETSSLSATRTDTASFSGRRRSKHQTRNNRKRSRKNRRFPRHPHFGLLSPLNYNGDCSHHYERMMTKCATLSGSEWFPACDRNGNYVAKQCMTSSKGKLGKCWCVTNTGHPIANTWTDGPLSCTG